MRRRIICRRGISRWQIEIERLPVRSPVQVCKQIHLAPDPLHSNDPHRLDAKCANFAAKTLGFRRHTLISQLTGCGEKRN